MLTQKILQELLEYNQETGIFTWKVQKAWHSPIGQIAGTPHSSGYVKIKINGKIYRAHRLAWLFVYGEFPELLIDHIDGNPSNNCLCNLRQANYKQNAYNSGIPKNNTSGYKGVCKDEDRDLHIASATIEGKVHFIGRFTTPEEASKAYDIFVKSRHKDFYRDTTKE